MGTVRYVFWCFLMALTACSGDSGDQGQRADAVIIPVEPGVSWTLAQQRKATLSNINYSLTFRVPNTPDGPITAKEIVTFKLSDNSADLQFDFQAPEGSVSRLVVNGTAIPADHRLEHIVIPAGYLRASDNTVEFEFTAGETSLNRSPDFLYTLFVPDRARTAFPVFDQPNLKATYELSLELPKSWRALANAPLLSTIDTGDYYLHAFERSDPLSSYLFSFVAGEFQEITTTVDGREMTLLHRETDEAKVARNLDAIFRLHADALNWLEEYAGIDYPFKKFDFAAIPAFQYGGMEHVGAIQYRAASLFHDEDPSEAQLLGRASLIAHETAHMWFGDLVTMDWFNDVWTKEVFANFMASKIVNPGFPGIDHDLNFLLSRYPAAYSVDRTEGANPIRQNLPNLNEAGTMYGAIIYNKAPIMMRQLETMLGAETFRSGIREYLKTFAGGNATWPDLIDILDARSPQDLKAWSEVWVNTAGRPLFKLAAADDSMQLRQHDTSGADRFWPQQFALASAGNLDTSYDALFAARDYRIGGPLADAAPEDLLVNADGMGYGLFPSSIAFARTHWDQMSDLQKGALAINLFEQMQEGNPDVTPGAFVDLLIWACDREDNELLLGTLLGQMETTFWSFLGERERLSFTGPIEAMLWRGTTAQDNPASTRKVFFNRYRNTALSAGALDRLMAVWSGAQALEGITLSEREMTALAAVLAIKRPDSADTLLSEQMTRIKNPDARRRFTFLMPALSPDAAVRDAFFKRLELVENRAVESWVLEGLGYLHHPLRINSAEKYILPSLELLEEIQRTGDIFFPIGWTGQSLANHRSDNAVKIVRDFLAARPDYNHQLRLKTLQAADRLFRANRILTGQGVR